MTDIDLLKQTFTKIYDENTWAMGQEESRSGKGSTVNFTLSVSYNLISCIEQYNIKNIVDTSCGDWHWMKYIQKNLCDYTGIDIVESVIKQNKEKYENETTKFLCMDFLSYLKSLPDTSVDLIFCRHTCEHLPKDYIFDFFIECKRVAKYLLLTSKKTTPDEICNKELEFPSCTYRALDFDKPPFESFFKPYFLKEYYDGPTTTYDPQMCIYLYKFN